MFYNSIYARTIEFVGITSTTIKPQDSEALLYHPFQTSKNESFKTRAGKT